jgi:hypothetical protein
MTLIVSPGFSGYPQKIEKDTDSEHSDNDFWEEDPNALYKKGVYVIYFDGPSGGHASIAIDDNINGFLCGIPGLEPDGLGNYLTRFDKKFETSEETLPDHLTFDDMTSSSREVDCRLPEVMERLSRQTSSSGPADWAFAPRSYNVTVCALKVSEAQKKTLRLLCDNPRFRLGTCMNNVASLLHEAEIITIPYLSSIAPCLGMSYLEKQLEQGDPRIGFILKTAATSIS